MTGISLSPAVPPALVAQQVAILREAGMHSLADRLHAAFSVLEPARPASSPTKPASLFDDDALGAPALSTPEQSPARKTTKS